MTPRYSEIARWYEERAGGPSPSRVARLARLIEEQDIDLARCSLAVTTDPRFLERGNRTAKGWPLGAAEGVRYYLVETASGGGGSC